MYFDQAVDLIYSPVLQLNKASSFDIEAHVFDLNLSISNGKNVTVSFLLLDGIYIFQRNKNSWKFNL